MGINRKKSDWSSGYNLKSYVPAKPDFLLMTAKIEIFVTTKLNYAGYGPIGVYVNIGYEPLPEGYKTLPDSQFDSYEPDPGYIKNTGLRTPLFTGGFISSPLLVDGSY